MNNKIKILFLVVVVLLFAATVSNAQAALIELTPTVVSVAAGDTFSLIVNVDSQTLPTITVKSELLYPADMLEPVSFAIDPNWIQLPKSGFDNIGDGVIVKTAGYPGGFFGVKTFGKVTFLAKKSGVATVIIGSNSLALNDQSKNKLDGVKNAQVNISGARLAQTPASSNITGETGQTTTTSTNTPAVSNGENATNATSATPNETPNTVATGSQTAAVAGPFGKFSAGKLILALFVLAALATLGRQLYVKRSIF
jgi:hypothetical protein